MVKAYKVIWVLLVVLLASCADKTSLRSSTEHLSSQSTVESLPKVNGPATPRATNVPPPALPPAYEKVDPFKGKKFTMSAVDAPLTKVLYAIADSAGLNLVISPEVDLNRTITATFRNTPLKDALYVVMELAALDYDVKGNVLYVKEMITKTFKLPYISSQVSYSGSLGGSATTGTGTTTGGGILGGGLGGTSGTSGTGSNLGGGLQGSFQVDFQSGEEQGDFYGQLEINLRSLLDADRGESYVLNRFTGTLIVRARKSTIKSVEELLRSIKKEVKKQVLIEAKIVEIELSDSTAYGIDWNRLLLNALGSRVNLDISQNSEFGDSSFFTLRVSAYQFSAILNAISRYGKSRILANPRIMTVNGQPALITAGISVPFFRRQAQFITGGISSLQSTNVYIDTVLHGVMLGVVPFVDGDNEIVLNIVPISSRLAGERRFPETGQELANAPILNIKELGTIVRVRDGEMVVIGGLIDTSDSQNITGTPLLRNIPMVGKVFRKEENTMVKRELVIFLRPTLVEVRD